MSNINPSDVAEWFAERGFRVRISETDHSAEVRQSPWGRKAPSRDHHVWVDLLADDGRVMQAGYGSGVTAEDAMNRARERYRQEQEGGHGRGPRELP